MATPQKGTSDIAQHSRTSDRFLIKDPVHGSIELHGDYLVSIINSEEFQRLRKIKQLGGACYVYPGATHTRFEHSIGVCYIASELIEHLKKISDLRQDDKNSTAEIFEKWSKPKDNPSDQDPKSGGKKKPIKPDIVKCVKTAALCHDLGHGPFSHLYDFAVTKKADQPNKKVDQTNKKVDQPNKKVENEHWKHHEYRSVEIFKRILNSHVNRLGFSEDEIELVGELITFSEDYKEYKISDPDPEEAVKKTLDNWLTNLKELAKENGKNGEEKNYNEIIFLFEIVANGITGVDVDKMDYFLRDGHYTGLTGTFDWRRYIQTLEIRKWNGFNRLCSKKKEALEIYQLFHIRNQLYHQAYRHKTTIAVEYMLKQALIKANDNLFITLTIGGEKKSILSAWENMEFFLRLTDSIEDIIMLTPDGNHGDIELLPYFFQLWTEKNPPKKGRIQEAKRIIADVRKRNLMKFIGEINLGIMKVTKDAVKKQLTDEIGIQDGVQAEIVIEDAVFHYGMKDKDPIQNYLFTTKDSEDDSPRPVQRKEVSLMLPETFIETKWMFYVIQTNETKIPDDKIIVLRKFFKTNF